MKANLKLPSYLRWARVEILNKKKASIGSMWEPYVPSSEKVDGDELLDRKRSKYLAVPGIDIPILIERCVLVGSKLPPFDLSVLSYKHEDLL